MFCGFMFQLNCSISFDFPERMPPPSPRFVPENLAPALGFLGRCPQCRDSVETLDSQKVPFPIVHLLNFLGSGLDAFVMHSPSRIATGYQTSIGKGKSTGEATRGIHQKTHWKFGGGKNRRGGGLPRNGSLRGRAVWQPGGRVCSARALATRAAGDELLRRGDGAESLGRRRRGDRWPWVKTNGIPFWLVGAPPILEPILVVGLGCSVGVRGFDPWPGGDLAILTWLLLGWILRLELFGKSRVSPLNPPQPS